MKTLNTITRAIICGTAIALGTAAFIHNPAHLVTAGIIFAIGLNVEWTEREDRI